MSNGRGHDCSRSVVSRPETVKTAGLRVGRGRLHHHGVKGRAQSRVGDTVTEGNASGRRMGCVTAHRGRCVYSGLFRSTDRDYTRCCATPRQAAPHEAALVTNRVVHRVGFGFRCGFLGLLHLEPRA